MSPGLIAPSHKKALRFSANKSQQLWLLSLKYANYRLTFVNKMFPALPQFTVLPAFTALSRTSFRVSQSTRPGTLVWSLARQGSAGFLPSFQKALPWRSPGTQLGPPTFSLHHTRTRRPQLLSRVVL